MNVEYTEKISESKWEEMLRKSENSYFFHTPAWAKILEDTYGYRIATRLYEIEGNEVLIPMMESKKYRFFYYYGSMPVGYGGIFSTSDVSSETLKKILKDIVGGRHLFFNLLLPPFLSFSIQEDSGIRQVDSEWNYTHMLSLEKGFEYIWKEKFRKNVKRSVKKAEKSDIEIIKDNTLQSFKEYYKLYVESSKRWGYKNPPQPFKFYEKLHKFGSGNIQLRLAIKDDEAIAARLNFYYGSNVFCWGNVSLTEYQKYYPTDLLHKIAIEDACEAGFKYYNFGASGNLEGVRKFKEGFGAERVILKKCIVWSRLGKIVNMVLRR